jgi:tetratricopeptide (TPR) repeat protein
MPTYRFSYLHLLFLFFILSILLYIDFRHDPVKAKIHIKNIPVLSSFISEREKLERRAKVITLNHEIPEFEGLAQFIRNPNQQESSLESYLHYYSALTNMFPDLAEGHAVLGFCYFYSGKKDLAIEEYKRAVELKPSFFYFYYDLALIYLDRANYYAAHELFKKALGCDVKETLGTILSSKTFLQLMGAMNEGDKKKMLALQEDYKKASEYMAISNYCLKNKITGRGDFGPVTLRIF